MSAPVAVVRMAVDDAYGTKVFDRPKFTVWPVYVPEGSANTSDFTDEVINRVMRKLEVWETLG